MSARVRRAVALLILLAVACSLLPTAVGGAEERLPTLFIADEVWYKDVSEPLLEKDGQYYLPLEAIAVLPSVTLTEDTALGAVLLTRGTRTYAFDTASGVQIRAEGDRTLSLLHANGTVYLPLSDVLGALSIGFELHTYQSGTHAVRINDGSGLFLFASLLRMYAAEETPPTRTVSPAAPLHSGISFRFAANAEDISAISSVTPGTLLLINAETLLTYAENRNGADYRTFVTHLLRLIAGGAIPALYTAEDSPVLALHALTLGNAWLFENLHRTALYYLSDLALTQDQQALYDATGMVRLTNIPIPGRNADR